MDSHEGNEGKRDHDEPENEQGFHSSCMLGDEGYNAAKNE
jgi:hypothetical protein